MVTWDILPRNNDLTRLYDPISRWTKLQLVERYNRPAEWAVEGPASQLVWFPQDGGCVLLRDGEQIASGLVSAIRRWGQHEGGSMVERMRVSFTADLSRLGCRIVYPDPAHAVVNAVTQYPTAYDTRTGTVEDLVLGYARSNIGDLALTDRREPRLRLPASLARGGTTTVTARLDNLGVLMQTLADAGGLRLGTVHVEPGPWVDLTIQAVADLSADIRFGSVDSAAVGIVSDWSWELGRPTATRAIVGGAGELAARSFLRRTDSSAESHWGTVAEHMQDATSTSDGVEMAREGDKALAEGANPFEVQFTPVLGPDLEYRRDVNVGDIVGYDLPGFAPGTEKVRQVTTTVEVRSGEPTERIEVVVGTPEAGLTRPQKQTARALRGVATIQRSK